MRSYRAVVVENAPLNRHNRQHHLLTFSPPRGAAKPRPGQFYMISTGVTPLEPLLKRPFCYLRTTGEGIQLLYRVKGKGTALLRDVPVGADIDVLGPLGKPYPGAPAKLAPLVVAGGVAVASVFPLIKKLGKRCSVVLGAESADSILLLDEIERLAGNVRVCTDDGSHGTRGNVLDVLRGIKVDKGTALYLCGPREMIRAVSAFAHEKGVRWGYASLEEFMACGIGACMGCSVMTSKGYKRVCKEGPVFRIGDLAF